MYVLFMIISKLIFKTLTIYKFYAKIFFCVYQRIILFVSTKIPFTFSRIFINSVRQIMIIKCSGTKQRISTKFSSKSWCVSPVYLFNIVTLWNNLRALDTRLENKLYTRYCLLFHTIFAPITAMHVSVYKYVDFSMQCICLPYFLENGARTLLQNGCIKFCTYMLVVYQIEHLSAFVCSLKSYSGVENCINLRNKWM